jgi:hypothetical protein
MAKDSCTPFDAAYQWNANEREIKGKQQDTAALKW